MRLRIRHRTEYAYADLAAGSVQYVRLTPRDEPVQKVLSWDLRVPGNSVPWQDGFGNLVHTVGMADTYDHLVLEVEGEVETVETNGILPLSPGGPPPEAYLRPTPMTQPDDQILLFSKEFATQNSRSILPSLHALMAGIHETILPSATTSLVHTAAAEVLARRSGGCQDHAHLFIACCRASGIPARYVSGYLHTAAEDTRHLATHAWAEALVDYLGWVSFDPFNCQSATHAYVRLAVAFDDQGAAPVRGVHRGGGEERMRVSVQVQAVQSAQQ